MAATLHFNIEVAEDSDMSAEELAVILGRVLQHQYHNTIRPRRWWVTSALNWEDHCVIPGREAEYVISPAGDPTPTLLLSATDPAQSFDEDEDRF